jgi:hypothetical protein
MGKPSAGNAALSPVEHIDRAKTSRGSETSQYPEENKTISDSPSSGERKGISPNRRQETAAGVAGRYWRKPRNERVELNRSGKSGHRG